MFSLMTLQFVLQTYTCAYVKAKSLELDRTLHMIAIAAAATIWLATVIVSSSCGDRLRAKPCFVITAFLLFSVGQASTVMLVSDKSYMLAASLMQLSICVALALYTCCLRENFTVLYSHIFFGIFLCVALGMTFVLNYDHEFWISILIALGTSLWGSFIANNLIAIKD